MKTEEEALEAAVLSVCTGLAKHQTPIERQYIVKHGYSENDVITITCLHMTINEPSGSLIFYGAGANIIHAFAKDKWNTVRRIG